MSTHATERERDAHHRLITDKWSGARAPGFRSWQREMLANGRGIFQHEDDEHVAELGVSSVLPHTM